MLRNEPTGLHPEAERAANWMRGRLVGALRAQGGSQAAFAVLRQASRTYGADATDDALRLIRQEASRRPVR